VGDEVASGLSPQTPAIFADSIPRFS
jgi:hypothetical protein